MKLTKTLINKTINNLKFSPNEPFLTEVFDVGDEKYFIIKAIEILRREQIGSHELKQAIKSLILATIKNDEKSARSQNTRENSKKVKTT